MTINNQVINDYFNWLFDLVTADRFASNISYKKLLMRLHDTRFIYIIPRDKNRAEDGIDLRYRFAYRNQDIPDAEKYLTGPCSVLEMMIALAIRCEETIMDDPQLGDRTGQWFWGMINSLGLGAMHNRNFDKDYVDDVITRFMEREYEPNGKGGLFFIRSTNKDLRNVEIWYQLCEYLDSIV